MFALNLVILCLNTASYVINRNVRIHTQQKKTSLKVIGKITF